MEHTAINDCLEEWQTLSSEYIALEKNHQDYLKKLDELTDLQQKCTKGIAHQRYRINIIKQSLNKLNLKSDEDDQERENLLLTDFIRRKAQLHEMEHVLPRPNGLYLKIILGNINVSILNKNDKFRYKDEYEKFKLVMSLLALFFSLINLLTSFRVLDLLHMFLLVWYYCTLTIRESILKVNGSRIKGWWRTHHFISTALSAILLIWPDGEVYYAFRRQFMSFNLYISFVQYLQFMYQRGCLYRLKALGERHNMDVTVEGFHSWMWRGLGFLVPFLFIGYFWELYNAYTLYHLAQLPNAQWHVFALSALFFILFLGNTLTTVMTIPEKIKERMKLKYRFTKLDKYIWTHKKRRVSFRNIESPVRRTEAARANSFSRRRIITNDDEGVTPLPESTEELNAPKNSPSSDSLIDFVQVESAAESGVEELDANLEMSEVEYSGTQSDMDEEAASLLKETE